MELSPKDRLIVALDVEDLKVGEQLVEELKGVCNTFKIGIQLFTSFGHKAIEMVKRKGCKVFLDMKYYDIPTKVAAACRAAAKLSTSMLTIHTIGGVEMLRAASEALKEEEPRPLLFGVTILTSINQEILNQEIGLGGEVEGEVIRLSRLAHEASLDGVVVSAGDVCKVREACGENFLIMTPGVRPLGYKAPDDQKRVKTPGAAIRKGANFIVVGRPIIHASNPLRAATQILREIEENV
jgi:orotidine-5'-phosphate decarboxylase